ncbi:sulfotransferase family protein [Candidatus Chloroploca asiatica]|uniref:Sulfotransferase n=1 Tax=Candidatus Chloroploca asiatica TaxID=1506545 RepID=A0A2H3KJZ5_9CHLR|nr:sulfotransferase [Candidatus Chloroploca asiatica]PDV98288.1 hypothetical protein A9Q02_22405 [Candidatus Chloroploca asiatica]
MTMPNFLVIGVAKAGTTSLHAYLNQHPQIAMSQIKEPDFFEYGEVDQPPPASSAPYPYAIQTLTTYQALFADLPTTALHGEASPSNFEARACERISRYLPNAKFICILRQPVDRAYSAFAMHTKRGKEPETDFCRAYQDSARRWQKRFEGHLPAYACRNAAWYVERLQDWLARFPRQQLHISLYDDLKDDPVTFVRKVYAFLEVDDSFTPNVSQIYNQGAGIRSTSVNQFVRQNNRVKQWIRPWLPQPLRQKITRWLTNLNQVPLPPLDPSLRNELTRPQHDDILRLQDIVGRDLSNWLAK